MSPPSTVREPRPGEQGMALVLALLILLALTVMGTALMLTIRTEAQIAGHQLRDAQALAIAEAGVQEAMLRLRTGEVPDNLNKRMVSLIYEAPPGSIPVSGADTTSLPTLQPSGSYLGYSSATKRWAPGSTTDLQVLTVRYKTSITGSPPDTQIVRWDDAANPKLNTATGTPVFTIVATGSKGKANRSVVADVTRARYNLFVRGALAAKVPISFNGNIKVCGHDHRFETPYLTEPPICNSGAWFSPAAHGTCLPGGWSASTITKQGSHTVIGEPADYSENQVGFYSGPWDALGLSQLEFWSWIGPSIPAVPGGVPQGIYYLDNDNVKQNNSGEWAFSGGNGEGFLYCDGKLSINGNLNFKGMIYCEGDLEINGNVWLLGGIIVDGSTVVKIANGSAVILYSTEAIQQTISKYGGQIRMLSWREF